MCLEAAQNRCIRFCLKLNSRSSIKSEDFEKILRKHSLSSSKFSISYRGAKLWNEILSTDEKELKSHMLFQKIVKSKLLAMENELSFF